MAHLSQGTCLFCFLKDFFRFHNMHIKKINDPKSGSILTPDFFRFHYMHIKKINDPKSGPILTPGPDGHRKKAITKAHYVTLYQVS
jgi:hypothetical protein